MNPTATGAAMRAADPTGLHKGLGFHTRPLEGEEIARLNWNLLHEDLSLPAAVLYEDKLQHNLNWMRRFMEAYGLKLAPHGKTTMAPKLFKMQLDAGAWGITLATAQQTLAAHAHGVRRVLMANQLIGKENMSIVARLLEDASFEYYCLVDSADQADQLGRFFQQRGQRLRVLLELGTEGGRTGVRTAEQRQATLDALARWPASLALCGVEVYEGVLHDEQAIRAYLQNGVEVTRALLAEGRFERRPAILSGAGSAWYDVVAEVFAAAQFGADVDLVLRPGCYLTHDVGAYREAQKRILAHNPIAREMNSGLIPALHVWAYVQSIPEPEKAIAGLGRRDAAFDSGLPVPALHYRPGMEMPQAAPAHWTVTKLMDQHAYLQIAAGDNVKVGDMVGFDIAHPCLTFDKWRSLVILDSSYKAIDVVETFF